MNPYNTGPPACDICHKAIGMELHLKHKVTSARLCWACKEKLTLHSPRDWVRETGVP